MKKLLITLLKITASIAILAYLVYDASHSKDGTNIFKRMLDEQKQWDLLFAAWLCVAVAVVITIVRWCYLVRALGITFSMRDALRIGFLGYFFNL